MVVNEDKGQAVQDELFRLTLDNGSDKVSWNNWLPANAVQ
jgi:hypothetical protein